MGWVEKIDEDENLSDHQKMTRKWAKLVRNKWNIAKDLIAPALPDLLKKYFQAELESSCVWVWRHNRSLNLTGEFDILFADSERNRLFLVQTSISPEKDDIIEFIGKIKIFRKLFPEYQDRVIVPIFAGIEMEKDVVDFATQNKMCALAYRDWEDLEILNFDQLSF